jgi:hypothetical protein
VLDEKSIEIYSSRDKIREQLISLSKDYLQLDNFDFSKSSYLSYIVNMLASLDSNLLYYISSVYREQFLTKAVQRESVLNLANIIGYKPLLAIPARCKILIEFPLASTATRTDRLLELIGRNNDNSNDEEGVEKTVFKVYSSDNVLFSLENSVVITVSPQDIVQVKQQVYVSNGGSTSVGWKTIEHRVSNGNVQFFADFIQLVDISETFTVPELLPNEFHSINYNFNKTGSIADVDLFTITTTTNGVLDKWLRKESIFGIGPDEKAFTYRETEKGITISFGNGVIGKQPRKGTNVIVTVGLTRGDKGNVISGNIKRSDAARMLVTFANGQTGVKFVNLKVINKEPSQFGVNPPTIDEVRSNAINSVSANSRLVSQRDFQNADIIVQGLPIKNVFQVLKRSDLKRNEITLFTELVYNNVVVPTRNATLTIEASDIENSSSYQIKSEETVVTIDNEQYITIFDLFLNQYTNEVGYYYFISETELPVTLLTQEPSLDPTKIFPVFSYYSSDRTSDPEQLKVELHCNILDTTSNFSCKVSVDWPSINGVSEYMLFDTTSQLSSEFSSVKIFSTHPDPGETQIDTMDLTYVPDGKPVEFTYTIYKNPANSAPIEICTCRNSIILKRDLSDFMYSQVTPNSSGDDITTYTLYDVPVIKKDYFDNLLNKSLFTSSVLQKIIEFDVYDYKMVTDYVNLKFANTTGFSTNMKYRDISRTPVIDLNPSISNINAVTVAVHGTRYVITDANNPWNEETGYPGTGCIAYFSDGNNKWNFEKLKVNDIIEVTNLNNINSGVALQNRVTTKMIYTGIELIEPRFSIPLQIRMTIIPSDSITITNQVLIRNIKDTLINKLAPSFGYNKSLLRSVIVKVVQDIPGVEHCELLEPSFNIKFEFDPYKNMTQDQLLRYTPELIFFSSENIIIDVKD